MNRVTLTVVLEKREGEQASETDRQRDRQTGQRGSRRPVRESGDCSNPGRRWWDWATGHKGGDKGSEEVDSGDLGDGICMCHTHAQHS